MVDVLRQGRKHRFVMVPHVLNPALVTCNLIGVNLTKNGGPLLK